MLRQRIISAFVLALSLVLIITMLPQNMLLLFLAAITCISFWEFLKVRFSNLLTMASMFLFIIFLSIAKLPFFNNLFIVLSIATYLFATIFILSYPLNKNFLKNRLTWSVMGFLSHLGFYAAIYQILIIDHPASFYPGPFNDRVFILFIILISVLMDSIAFFAGKKFGRRPFISNVSPNKTLEGFLFAILLSPPLLLLLSMDAFSINVIFLFLLLFLACCFSVIGDGFASLMKRTIGIKDYSSLIPGHGGVFDRLDSHIATFPTFILFLNLLVL